MTAAPQPVAKTERAQQTTKESGNVKTLFGAAAKALARHDGDEPEPPRKKEKGDSEKGRAGFVKAARKIMRRVRQRQASRYRPWGGGTAMHGRLRAPRSSAVAVLRGIARGMESLRHALERAFGPGPTPQDIERREREAEGRQLAANADAVDAAARFRQWLEEQRQRVEEENEARIHRRRASADDDEPEPPRKKEKGDSEKGRRGFVKAARKIMRRVRQRQAPARAAAFLADTLDWLNLWHGNNSATHHGSDFHSAPTNHLSPRL